MSDTLSQDDMVFLSSLTWWTASQSQPVIIKGGIRGNSYLILVSDLTHVWYSKAGEDDIRFCHTIFNKAINIEKTSDILGLMEDFLINGDPKAEINFQPSESRNLVLKIKIELKVCFPFFWEYELIKVNRHQTKEILLGQLVAPLVSTVHCLEKRTNYLKQQFTELEDEYKKRLTPLEKNSYKTSFIDEEYAWGQLLQKNPDPNKEENAKLDRIEFSEATKYFMTQSTKTFLGVKSNEPIAKEKDLLGNPKRKNLKESTMQLLSPKKKTRKSKSKSKSNSKAKIKEEEKLNDKKAKKDKKKNLEFL